MAYLTDRKRVHGLGSGRSGTTHFWHQTVLSAALVVLIPLFVFTFGRVLGEDYATVLAYYQQPFPALVALATAVVGLVHFAKGAQVLIEDYSDGLTRKALIVAVKCLGYGLALVSVYALIRLAL